MADQVSSQAIESLSSSQSVKISADVNANTAANPIFAQLADGTNSMSLVVIDSAYGATPTAAPIAGKYEATPTTFADGDATHLLTDENGRLQVDIASITIGAEKAEDSAHTTADVGNFILGVRQDTLASSTSADGDYSAFKLNAAGALYVTDSTAGASIYAEDSAHTTADQGQFILSVRADTLTAGTGTDGDYAALLTNGSGELYTKDTDVETAITNLTHDEDAAHTTGDKGVQILAVRNDTLASLSDTDGDYSPLQVDANGAVYTSIANSSGAVNSASAPLFVSVVDAAVSNTEVLDYDTTASVAAGASDNHDYTVTATNTLIVDFVWASSAQPLKVEVQSGPVASLTTKAVKFTAASNPEVEFKFNGKLEVPDTSTGTLRVIRENVGRQASDVYSTIAGNEV